MEPCRLEQLESDFSAPAVPKTFIYFFPIVAVCLIVWTIWILQLQDIWEGKPVIYFFFTIYFYSLEANY